MLPGSWPTQRFFVVALMEAASRLAQSLSCSRISEGWSRLALPRGLKRTSRTPPDAALDRRNCIAPFWRLRAASASATRRPDCVVILNLQAASVAFAVEQLRARLSANNLGCIMVASAPPKINREDSRF